MKARIERPAPPLLIVLSGPSGAGKDAVLNRLKETTFPLQYVTTVTTRPRRPNERDNEHYHFVPVAKFQEMLRDGELLESANVYGNWYGVPKQPVRQALAAGQDIIVKVDVQGAATIKKIAPQAIFIFLTAPSMEELMQRLKERRTESPFDLELRIKTAEAEIRQVPLFDYIVLNARDKIDQAVADIQAIIRAEKCRVSSRRITL